MNNKQEENLNYSDEENDSEEDFEMAITSECMCLFCSNICSTVNATITHMIDEHKFDLIKKCVDRKYNCYSFIKLINYQRQMKLSVNDLSETIEKLSKPLDDRYLQPVIEDDSLLTFDIEEFLDTDKDIEENEIKMRKLIEEKTKENLVCELKAYEMKINDLQMFIKKLLDHEDHRTSLARPGYGGNNISGDGDDDNAEITAQTSTMKHSLEHVDQEYFSSYSHFSIHHDMLNDEPRTSAYKQAILENRQLFLNSKVLDIGCGTGILSLFAVDAGAASVLAIDQSDIILKAIEIAKENKKTEKINFVQTKLEDIDKSLIDEKCKFDMIVSEWMGYMLIYEGMLDTVLHARDNYLNENGVLLPNQCSLVIAGVSDINGYDKLINFWNNVYGYKMSTMKRECLRDVDVTNVASENICTTSEIIRNFDLMNCTIEETKLIRNEFKLKCKENTQLTAFAIWFDCDFNHEKLNKKLTLSTSPFSPSTHWKQCSLYLQVPLNIQKDEYINGIITIERVDNSRSLNITLEMLDKHLTQTFVLE